jgi:hypothetical protein
MAPAVSAMFETPSGDLVIFSWEAISRRARVCGELIAHLHRIAA